MTNPPNYPYPGQPAGQGIPNQPPPQGFPQGQPPQPPQPPYQGQPQPGYPQQPPYGGFPPPQGQPGQPGGFPPPQGQPGQPGGFPPPHGQQPGQPGGFPPPQQRPSNNGGGKNSLLTIGIGAVLLIVVLGGIFGATKLFQSDGEKIEAGQCAKLSGSTTKPEFAIKECSDPDANYVVAERLDSSTADCATDDYASYYLTGKNGYKVCLQLNVVEGDCVKEGSYSAASTKVACGSTADYKIGRVVKGSAAASACGSDYTENEVIAYPKPNPMTLCLVSADD